MIVKKRDKVTHQPPEISTQVSSNKPESQDDDLENQILNHVKPPPYAY
jgi:hypothetical protein